MKRRYAVALSCLLPLLAHAQAARDLLEQIERAEREAPAWLEEQQRVFGRNSISADGVTNPGLIPFGVVAEVAFLRFRSQIGQPESLRRNLRANFGGSGADEIAAGAQQFAEDVRNEEGRSLDATCAKVVSAEPWNSIDALRMAEEFVAIENRRMDPIGLGRSRRRSRSR